MKVPKGLLHTEENLSIFHVRNATWRVNFWHTVVGRLLCLHWVMQPGQRRLNIVRNNINVTDPAFEHECGPFKIFKHVLQESYYLGC